MTKIIANKKISISVSKCLGIFNNLLSTSAHTHTHTYVPHILLLPFQENLFPLFSNFSTNIPIAYTSIMISLVLLPLQFQQHPP